MISLLKIFIQIQELCQPIFFYFSSSKESDDTKKRVLVEQQAHLSLATDARKYYKECIARAKTSDSTVHISFDMAQQVGVEKIMVAIGLPSLSDFVLHRFNDFNFRCIIRRTRCNQDPCILKLLGNAAYLV